MTTPGLHPALEPAESLDWTRLNAFLTQGLVEDERLEYKDRVVPSVLETAAAMANTRGGTIVVGVREEATPNAPGTWDGVSGDPQEAVNNTNWSYCTPAVRMHSYPLVHPTSGNTVLVLAVEPAIQPPHWHRDKGILIRVGDQNRLAPPELLEAWYSARRAGNPSEHALRTRATAAVTYGSPGFSMSLWPTSVVPTSRFGPDTDDALDRLAGAILPPDGWEGHPHRTEYVLEAERADRHLLAAVDEHAYVRFLHTARAEPAVVAVDFVVDLRGLINEYTRRLVFAELALTTVVDAPPPFRAELLILYGSKWRISPPASSLDFVDPFIPPAPEVESPATVDVNLIAGGAADAATQLLVGTLRRLGWRNFDSLVQHLSSHLAPAVTTLYDAA